MDPRLTLILLVLMFVVPVGVAIVLHSFEGRSPFEGESLEFIEQMRSAYGLDLTAADSHMLTALTTTTSGNLASYHATICRLPGQRPRSPLHLRCATLCQISHGH